MLFTLEQFVLLAIVLFAGFLLGVASRPSTRKWKRRVAAQSATFTAYRDDAEDRVRAAQQRARALETETAALRADHADAERTVATPKAAPPETEPAPRPALALVETSAPVAQSAARPAFPVAPVPPVAHAPTEPTPPAMTPAPSDGARDALTRVHGIDDALDMRLSALGVLRFEDITNMSAEDEMALEERLALPVGYVAREQWRMQAALLRAGRVDEHAAQFGDAETSTGA